MAPDATGKRGNGWLDTKKGRFGVHVVVLSLLMISWELYGSTVPRALFAPPSAIALSIVELIFQEDVVSRAYAISIASLLIGYGAAVVAGVAVGVLMGRNRRVDAVLDPYISFFYALPIIALIPLLIVWFGVAFELRVVLVFLSGFFLICLNTAAGVKQVEHDLLDVARVNCASELQTVRTVALPAALPFIFSGLRIALAQSLIGVIVAEMTTTVTGLGALILHYANFFQTDRMFVPILVIMITSIALSGGMRALQRRMTPWAIRG